MPACPKCHAAYDADSRYCKACGAALAPPQQLELEDEDTLILRLLQGGRLETGAGRPARIWLLDPTGQQVEKASELTEELSVIGRREDCAIVLPSNTVSRHHAQVRHDAAGSYYLSDLGSTNGTLLNGEPVIGEEPLNDRDEIGVGTFRLIFRTG